MLRCTFFSHLLFYTFVLFVTRIESEEILQLDTIDAENVTNIDNQTCEAQVNTYMFKMMVQNFDEVTNPNRHFFVQKTFGYTTYFRIFFRLHRKLKRKSSM